MLSRTVAAHLGALASSGTLRFIGTLPEEAVFGAAKATSVLRVVHALEPLEAGPECKVVGSVTCRAAVATRASDPILTRAIPYPRDATAIVVAGSYVVMIRPRPEAVLV